MIPPRILKLAFVPATPAQDPAAAGAPGGAPADPAAGAPMPAPGSAPAADPSAGGAPMDPSAAPPADPGAMAAAAGAGDPNAQAAQDLDAQMGDSKPPTDPNASVTSGQAGVVMDIVERTLTAVGKNKKNAPPAGAAPADPSAGAQPDPSQQPGPVTGMPGDMSAIQNGGPLKLGAADLLL